MNSVWEVLQAQGERHMKLIGAIQTEMPHTEDLLRDVETKWGRGGFIHIPKVGLDRDCNKASLFITLRDTKVDMLSKDASDVVFGWTCVKLAQFENGHFTRSNVLWDMVLTKAQHAALVAMGCVDPNSDPSKAVSVDFRRARLFPTVNREAFYALKLDQMGREARFDKLDSLRTAARKYFRESKISFPELGAARGFTEHPEYETVWAYYTAFTVDLPGETVEAAIDDTLYRTKVGRKFTYTREQYLALCAEWESAKAAMKEHAAEVRLMELGLLEEFGAGEVASDRGVIALATVQKTETYRAVPEEIKRWRVANAYREAPKPEKRVKAEAASSEPAAV